MSEHQCLGLASIDCDECCMYCAAPLLPDDRCSDETCENHYRRPTSLNRFGARNV